MDYEINMIEIRDKQTGALFFKQTPEEKDLINIKKTNTELKEKVQYLESLILDFISNQKNQEPNKI